MSAKRYDLVFNSVLEGFDLAQVKQSFAELFKVDVERVERVFAQQGNLIKADVEEALAQKYIAKLASLGVDVGRIEKGAPLEESELELVSQESSAGETEPQDDPEIAEPYIHTPESDENPQFTGRSSGSSRLVEFSFYGKGFEYFKIWIVNILLSILTLGIYSAWAKVRNKQYFYGNTQLDGSAFEYTAEPLKVLKGRLIAVAFLAIYSYCSHNLPMVGLALALLLLILTPWIVVMSLRFNARHTSYRNIPFQFVGSIGGAFMAFIVWPLIGIFSLFILMPFAWRAQVDYVSNNHKYGTEPFKFSVGVGAYYKMLGILLGATVLFFVALAAILGSAFSGLASQDPAAMMQMANKMIPIMLLYFAFYFVAGAYLITAMANIHFNNLSIQHHRFESDWSPISYAVLLFTNTIGIVLTLGLFIPFARIRMAQYKAEHTMIYAGADFDQFIADQTENANSVGEGFHDIFDIDISL